MMHNCLTPTCSRQGPRRGCLASRAAFKRGDGKGLSADGGGTHRKVCFSDSSMASVVVGSVTGTGEDSDVDESVDIDKFVLRLSRILCGVRKSREARKEMATAPWSSQDTLKCKHAVVLTTDNVLLHVSYLCDPSSSETRLDLDAER